MRDKLWIRVTRIRDVWVDVVTGEPFVSAQRMEASGKIEIKIVTTGGLGDDDDTHWLSEEDTKNLKDIFLNILIQGTQREAHREQQRQRQLEDNYRFVWGNSQEELQATGGADSDDVDF